MITKLYEFFKLITERALGYEDANDLVMIRHISKKDVKITLYNYINQNIIGYITATKSKDYFIVDRVAAEKGWGPFMYDLMLQSIYPLGLKPSHLSRPEALTIWNYYLTKNSHIQSTEITDSDPNYATEWQPDEALKARPAPEQLKLINRVYKLQPYPYFNQFVTDSEQKIAEYKINTNQVFKYSLDFFHDKYYTTSMAGESASIKVPMKDISDKYLLINKTNNNVQFIIQDKSKIFAYGELIGKPNYYQIVNVAAIEGFGPFLYDTMMLILNKPVRPSNSLTAEAYNVWANYINNRPDVDKEIASPPVTEVDFNQHLVHDPKYLRIVNFVYSINNPQRHAEMEQWQSDSLQFEQEMTQRLPNWKNIRFNYGKKWFNMQYPMEIAA